VPQRFTNIRTSPITVKRCATPPPRPHHHHHQTFPRGVPLALTSFASPPPSPPQSLQILSANLNVESAIEFLSATDYRKKGATG
jgi:hypothetical protein